MRACIYLGANLMETTIWVTILFQKLKGLYL